MTKYSLDKLKSDLIGKNGSVFIPNFIEKERAVSLAEEFKKYAYEENLSGDNQALQSKSCYNYISFLEMLCEKTPEISKIARQNVLPTFCYARVYLNGADLKEHTDRPCCEVSVTINLSGDKEWPIYFQEKYTSQKINEYILTPGDAVVYDGYLIPHWRNIFDGQEYIQVFLHYVRSRGELSSMYFDKMSSNYSLNSKTGEYEFKKIAGLL